MTIPTDTPTPSLQTPVPPTLSLILDDGKPTSSGKCSADDQSFTSKHPKENQFLVQPDLEKQFQAHLTEKHSTVKA
jgi:hypothetical protein